MPEPLYQVWNKPEPGYPVILKHDGFSTVDSQDCVCYIEKQLIGSQPRLIATIDAPYCSISDRPEDYKIWRYWGIY